MRILLLLTALLACGPVSSSEKPAPLTATKIPALQEKASSGDAQAQFELGEAYFKGNGVERDKEQGKQWIEKAAAQEYPAALISCQPGVESSPRIRSRSRRLAGLSLRRERMTATNFQSSSRSRSCR